MTEGTRHQTTMSGPVHLPDPTRPPSPVSGCDVCEALDKQRAQAEADQDTRRATGCEMEMRQHPHGGRL